VALHAQFRTDELVEAKLPSRLIKAQKTKIEVQHIDHAMTKDGVALIHAFKWLEDQLNQKIEVTEFDFAEQIVFFRSQQEGYFGESFPAIIGYNENGAIVHYRPDRDNSKIIKKEGMLLCDSGAQYIDGTTDITRTIALNSPTDAQKENYTLVLKGHIALDRILFPEGTTGSQLDALARQFLWQKGLNYGHGTGHGVGYFLNVHEAPQGYSPGSSARATTTLLEGMLSSNEPGYYEPGEYGIRIENLVLVEKSTIDKFLRHRTMTQFPIDTSLIELSLVTEEEREWLNNYHQEVERRLMPFLDDEHQGWLKDKCQKI
jgi:Xaa-Pro aminopeptidase